jgi:hypothetical protein
VAAAENEPAVQEPSATALTVEQVEEIARRVFRESG